MWIGKVPRVLGASLRFKYVWPALLSVALLGGLCAVAESGGAQGAAAEASCPPKPASAPATPPAPGLTQPAPEEILVCVAAQPITAATYAHWAVVAENSAGPPSKGRRPDPHVILTQVMGFLISADWVLGEATALHVETSSAEVRRTFDRIRRQQFPKAAELTRFLRQTGETVEDLLLRVKLQLDSERIQRKVVVGDRTARSRNRALRRFTREFQLKWKSQTYCDPRYVTRDCGHVQSAL